KTLVRLEPSAHEASPCHPGCQNGTPSRRQPLEMQTLRRPSVATKFSARRTGSREPGRLLRPGLCAWDLALAASLLPAILQSGNKLLGAVHTIRNAQEACGKSHRLMSRSSSVQLTNMLVSVHSDDATTENQ